MKKQKSSLSSVLVKASLLAITLSAVVYLTIYSRSPDFSQSISTFMGVDPTLYKPACDENLLTQNPKKHEPEVYIEIDTKRVEKDLVSKLYFQLLCKGFTDAKASRSGLNGETQWIPIKASFFNKEFLWNGEAYIKVDNWVFKNKAIGLTLDRIQERVGDTTHHGK